MYSLPVHRATVYILGILLGYGLRMFKGYKLTKVKIKKNKSLEFNLLIDFFYT